MKTQLNKKHSELVSEHKNEINLILGVTPSPPTTTPRQVTHVSEADLEAHTAQLEADGWELVSVRSANLTNGRWVVVAEKPFHTDL